MNNLGLIFCIIANISLFSFTVQNPRLDAVQNAPAISPVQDKKIFIPVISKAEDLQGYFVATNGSDTNPGTQLSPWKTIGKATRTVKAGDTVYIRGGIYTESVKLDTSGTASNPIKIMAYPGEAPAIEGNNLLPTNYDGLVSIDGDWVQLSGLEVRNSKYSGIMLIGQHDVASNVFVHHSQKSGAHISGDYSIVENSRLWRNSLQNEFGNGAGASSGLSAGRDEVNGLTEYAIMRKNVVWENWGQGIDTYESDHTIMEDNISHDNWNTNIYLSDSTNVLCQRNFVYMTPGSYMSGYGDNVGIMVGDELYTPPSANLTIINNIAYGNSQNFALFKGVQAGQINNILIANNTFVNSIGITGVILKGYHQNVHFENNLVQQDGTLPIIAIELSPDLTLSNNLWSKPHIAAATGPGDVIGDPKLAKTGEPYAPDWFKLTGLSPALNKALPIPEVGDDFFGNPRGSSPDIGAIEYFP